MKQRKFYVSLLSGCLLISSPSGPVMAASTGGTDNSTNKSITSISTSKEVHTLSLLSSVKVTARSTVKLTDVNMLEQDDGTIVTYTLTYSNNDSKPIMLIDYWSKVKTKGGTLYSPKLIAKDQEKKTVAPGSSVELTYTMKVGREVKLSDLNFLIVQWDFSQPNYERTLGKFNVPASYTISTPVGKTKTVRLGDSAVKVKVSGIKTYPGEDKKQYVKIGVNLNNISYKLLENPNIKWILRTPGGTNYPLTPDKDSTTVSVQAQANQSLSLLVSLPTSVKLAKSELLLVEEQGEQKAVLPVAALQLPEASSNNVETTVNQPSILSVDEQRLSTLLESAKVRLNDADYALNLSFVIKNEGKKAVTVPKYTFEVRTEEGTVYPIETKTLDNLKLNPGDIKTVKLDATIQGDGDTSKIKLYVMSPISQENNEENAGNTNALEFSYPVGIYAVPESVTNGDGLTTETVIKNDKGIFGVSIGSLQRLPWSDSDILAAKVTIRNAGTKTVQLPELEGLITIDSAQIEGDNELIYSQSGKLLSSGMTTEAYMLSKIPQELRMGRIELSLIEKVSEEERSEWITLNTSGLVQPISYVAEGKTYTFGTSQKEAEMGVRRTYLYPGTSSNIVYTEFEVTNNSLRQSALSKLVGYFKTSDGQYYHATAKQSEQSAGPGQKNIVTFWAKIPKSVKYSDLRLLIGEGVADGKFVTGDATATAYVNALSYEVPPKSINVQGNLKDIDLFPYTLSASNIRAYLTGASSVQIDINYTLSRDEDIEMADNEHKLALVFTDQSGKTFEKEMTLGTDLKIGMNQTLSWSLDDTLFENMRGGSYRITVYDQFQGQRLKIANQGYGYDLTKFPIENLE